MSYAKRYKIGRKKKKCKIIQKPPHSGDTTRKKYMKVGSKTDTSNRSIGFGESQNKLTNKIDHLIFNFLIF